MKNTKKNIAVRNAVEAKVSKANAELAELTEGGFPFELKDVVLTIRENEAGVKVMSGESDIVCVEAWPKRFDSEAEQGCIKAITHEINEAVKAVRIAVDERKSLPEIVNELSADGKTSVKAIEAMRQAGMSDEEIFKVLPGADMVRGDEAYRAARAAVVRANGSLGSCVVNSTRRYKEARMHIRRFPGGFVISADGKAIMATRWPKADKVLPAMIEFIEAEISAMAESRCAYFRRQQELMAKSEELADASAKIEEALAVAASL